MRLIPICDRAELCDAEARIVTVEGRELALFCIDGEPFALDNACPHRGGPLGAGDRVGSTLYCPLHAWAFDIRSGKSLSHPGVSVRTHRVEVTAGKVFVEVDP